ncbi:MAG TPA: hypothetical protein VIU11_27665 [Nakamurella sp.]
MRHETRPGSTPTAVGQLTPEPLVPPPKTLTASAALTGRTLTTAFGDTLPVLADLGQVAQYLGVHRATAYRRAARDPDSIPGLRRYGGSWRVATATLLDELGVPYTFDRPVS